MDGPWGSRPFEGICRGVNEKAYPIKKERRPSLQTLDA